MSLNGRYLPFYIGPKLLFFSLQLYISFGVAIINVVISCIITVCVRVCVYMCK